MKKMLFLILCATTAMFGSTGLYRDAAKSVVVDTRTGLVWQDNAAAANATKTWANAITTCEDLVLGGYTDWRLPNINELKSIRDTSRDVDPIIEPTFVNAATGFYWSSTSSAANAAFAWFVYFGDGSAAASTGKGAGYYVRCVRGQ